MLGPLAVRRRLCYNLATPGPDTHRGFVLGQDHDKRGQDRRDDDEAGSDLQEVLAAFGHDGRRSLPTSTHEDKVGADLRIVPRNRR